MKSKADKAFSKEILKAAEDVLRVDPLISMELGLGIEAGGIFASSSSFTNSVVVVAVNENDNGNDNDNDGDKSESKPESESSVTTTTTTKSKSTTTTIKIHQMVMEFQLNGGNAWAQAKVHGIKYGETGPVQLLSLGVANMDASLSGGWAQVKV